MNLKNAASANSRFHQVKKKLYDVLFDSKSGSDHASNLSTPVTAGMKRKATVTPITNTKRAKSDAGVAKTVTNPNDEESGDDEKLVPNVKIEKREEFLGDTELNIDRDEAYAMAEAA